MVQFIKNCHNLIFQNFRGAYFRAIRGDMGTEGHFFSWYKFTTLCHTIGMNILALKIPLLTAIMDTYLKFRPYMVRSLTILKEFLV